MPEDFQSHPRVEDKISYLYVEHARIEKDMESISIFDSIGKTPIPVASLLLLILGPGTSISHNAIKILSKNGVLIIWVGESGVRYYAHGYGETYSAKNILWQSYLVSHDDLRLEVVKNMYRKRFEGDKDIEIDIDIDLDLEGKSINQLRGLEGTRMRAVYKRESERTGVKWKGRKYNREKWDEGDPINRALSVANATLYGLCHSAIISIGMHPALGFIHIGHILAFVYDIADLYKAEITIPASFDVVSEGLENLERRVRTRCRDYFRKTDLLGRIIKDIYDVLNVKISDRKFPRYLNALKKYSQKVKTDDSYPVALWDPFNIIADGGRNYSLKGAYIGGDIEDDITEVIYGGLNETIGDITKEASDDEIKGVSKDKIKPQEDDWKKKEIK
ncbi:MAG: type I-E CRISPR-associated endonuclease Cas1e [Promethearchaeota archaeon]